MSSVEKQKNVFGEEIETCCESPITGFFRDGFCHTDGTDEGVHTVCVSMTEDFLEFSKSKGNDLSTPRPKFNFPGLKEGDSWCLCAERWVEAYEVSMAPKLYIKRTNLRTLDIVPLEILKKFAIDLN
jgi:uncharacterized protein (DUF2237 family)|tara:strand:- start:673 stop:1053 length:381 start_codon:yes stop_codon:yes gene_type:complete